MNKRAVVKTIEELPEEFTLEEIIERLIVLEKIEKGRADARAGNVFTETEAKQRLGKWLK